MKPFCRRQFKNILDFSFSVNGQKMQFFTALNKSLYMFTEMLKRSTEALLALGALSFSYILLKDIIKSK